MPKEVKLYMTEMSKIRFVGRIGNKLLCNRLLVVIKVLKIKKNDIKSYIKCYKMNNKRDRI